MGIYLWNISNILSQIKIYDMWENVIVNKTHYTIRCNIELVKDKSRDQMINSTKINFHIFEER